MKTLARPAQQDLWAITAYFNPVGYRRRLDNYHTFRRHLAVPLVTVELAQEGRFQLRSGDADVLIQRRDGDVLWQKERLLNIALGALPRHCDKVAWLDCDVVFARDDWFARARAVLEQCAVLQPFHRVHEIEGDVPPPVSAPLWAEPRGHSLAWQLQRGQMPAGLLRGNMRLAQGCHTGLAWVARREVLEAHGFYDVCVVGSGNRAMVCADLGRFEDAVDYLQMNPPWAAHYLAWARAHFDLVRGAVGCVEGDLVHLWHGDLRRRRYQERHHEFRVFLFDPAADLVLSADECWRWRSAKPDMQAYVRSYFASRQEDGGEVPSEARLLGGR